MNGRERGSAAARHSQAFLIDSLQRLVMRLEQRMDLIRRIHDLSDGDIMIHGVDDQCDEFAHIRNYKIRLLICGRRQISQVRL